MNFPLICLECCIIFSPKSMKTLLLLVDKCLYESIMCTLQVKKHLKGNKKISLYMQQCYVLSWSQQCNDIWNAESSVLVNYAEGSSVRCPMLKMSKLSITLSQEFQRSLKVKPSTFFLKNYKLAFVDFFCPVSGHRKVWHSLLMS